MAPETRAYKLMSVLQTYAPNGTVQAEIAFAFNQMVAEGYTDTEIEASTAKALYEGLTVGIWPWNSPYRSRPVE